MYENYYNKVKRCTGRKSKWRGTVGEGKGGPSYKPEENRKRLQIHLSIPCKNEINMKIYISQSFSRLNPESYQLSLLPRIKKNNTSFKCLNSCILVEVEGSDPSGPEGGNSTAHRQE